MTADDIVLHARLGWLVLCAMTVLSRLVLQVADAKWMRVIVDAWSESWTRRLWGWIEYLAALYVLVRLAGAWPALAMVDRVVVGGLVVLLSADGLLSLDPGGSGALAARLQGAWARRHPGASDRWLVGRVGLALGIAACAIGAAVALYRPLSGVYLLGALLVALCVLLIFFRVAQEEATLRTPRPLGVGPVPLTIPDRLEPLRPDLERVAPQLLYADRKALREGRCREVAARIRRRQRWIAWLLVPLVLLLLCAAAAWCFWRFPGGIGPWWLIAQLIGTLFFLVLSRRLSLETARRLDEAGDGTPKGTVASG